MADIERFIKVAQNEGFYVILRPGPYIGAERDNVSLDCWFVCFSIQFLLSIVKRAAYRIGFTPNILA